MKRTLLAISFLVLPTSIVLAAEENVTLPAKTESVAAAPAAVPAPPKVPAAESEKAKDWKGLQAQEQWVTRLKKQIDGEVRQLSEMRERVAGKYKLDPKKFETGGYTYDEENDAFVER